MLQLQVQMHLVRQVLPLPSKKMLPLRLQFHQLAVAQQLYPVQAHLLLEHQRLQQHLDVKKCKLSMKQLANKLQ